MTVLARDLEERLKVVCGHLKPAHAQLVDLVAEVIEQDAWSGVGVRSPKHWLTWQDGVDPATASKVPRLAAAKATHPATSAVFAEGSSLPAMGAARTAAMTSAAVNRCVWQLREPTLVQVSRGARTKGVLAIAGAEDRRLSHGLRRPIRVVSERGIGHRQPLRDERLEPIEHVRLGALTDTRLGSPAGQARTILRSRPT